MMKENEHAREEVKGEQEFVNVDSVEFRYFFSGEEKICSSREVICLCRQLPNIKCQVFQGGILIFSRGKFPSATSEFFLEC